MEFLEPWYAATDPAALARQLRSELPRDHVLAGIEVEALAQRQDRDDVLFALIDNSDRVAVVHLTFSVNTHANWPLTSFYPSLSAWASQRMVSDHDEFAA